MPRSNLSRCKYLFTKFIGIKNPIGLFGNFGDPLIILKSRLGSKHFFEPLVFPQYFDDVLWNQFANLIFRVNVLYSIQIECQLENIACHKLTDLIEYGRKVFVSRRNLLLFFKPAFLKEFIERVSFFNRLSTAVKQSKYFEILHIYLVVRCSLRRILKGFR